MDKDSKLKIPPLPRRMTSETVPDGQPKEQGGRILIESNGVPVWVDSSRTSETTRSSEASETERAKSLASEIKRKLGISEE